MNTTNHEHGIGWVESHWQLVNAEVDDDQRRDVRSRWNVYLMKWKSIVNMTCENHHGYGLVALQQQRQMSVVDDDQCVMGEVDWL